jgi:hypothetical protein
VSGLWADASLSNLRLLRRAIRGGWPVPVERRGPIMEEVLAPLREGNAPARRAIALAWVALEADGHNLALELAGGGRPLGGG